MAGGLDWMDPITEKPVLGSTEVWTVINPTMDTHPIHLHLVAFQIIDRRPFDFMNWKPGDDPVYTGPLNYPLAEEAGWKDTAQMPPGYVTRVIAKFDIKDKYVWHCHILEHEEHDMMRPFEVIDPVADASRKITLSQDTVTETIGTPHTLMVMLMTMGENRPASCRKGCPLQRNQRPECRTFCHRNNRSERDGGIYLHQFQAWKRYHCCKLRSSMGMEDPSSNPVTVEWVERVIPTPEFPSVIFPLISLSAMAVMVYAIRRTGK